jgi:hypothetical protein
MNAEPGQGRTSLPLAKMVRDLLEGVLGRDVEVTTGGPMVNPGADGGALVGIFVDGFLKLSALMLLDLPLAARAGAAIALVPSRVAEFAIEDGGLPEALLDNASEILNVATSLFNVGTAPHLRLERCYAPGDPLPNDVAQWVLAYVPRLDLVVDIKGYGDGVASVIVV